LNFDLFRVGIVSDPSCRCGAAFENLNISFWIVLYYNLLHYRYWISDMWQW
jgi:hypothetical protein